MNKFCTSIITIVFCILPITLAATEPKKGECDEAKIKTQDTLHQPLFDHSPLGALLSFSFARQKELVLNPEIMALMRDTLAHAKELKNAHMKFNQTVTDPEVIELKKCNSAAPFLFKADQAKARSGQAMIYLRKNHPNTLELFLKTDYYKYMNKINENFKQLAQKAPACIEVIVRTLEENKITSFDQLHEYV